MDYLVIEGYKTAAEEFSKEADLSADVDLDSIESRMKIREAIQKGRIMLQVWQVWTHLKELSKQAKRSIQEEHQSTFQKEGQKGQCR